MSSNHRRKGGPVFDVFQDTKDNEEADDFALIRSLQDFNQQIQHAEASGIDTNLVLNPPESQQSVSPTKRHSPQSSPHVPVDSSFFDAVDFEAPNESFTTDSPSKKQSFGNYGPALAPKPKKALFSTFPSSKSGNKENQASLDASATDLFNASSSLGKRQLTEPTFIRDKAANKKRAVEDDAPSQLPEPEDMPVIIDEGGKPPFSYAQLIGMSILRAPGRKMTLSQIYKWINDTFEFYRNAGTGWQNSIRHNLSLNKAFVKTERPKDDPGKGHYWTIADGFEMQFVRDKPQRRPVSSGQQAYGQFDAAAGDTYQLPAPISASAFALPPQPARPTVVDSSKFPGDNELSSDATVDAADQEEEPMPPPGRASRTALTPELEIHSSPPVPQLPNARSTPSLGGSRLTHSRSGGRKKRIDSFRDSGFYSSIESSAHRPQYVGPMQLTSEADHRSPVRKRGRAEDEIARMSRLRSSSFDHSSPAKASKITKPAKRARTSHNNEASPTLNSSSPLRPAQLGFPPLTPGLKLDPRLNTALPTASPTTLLERHRNSIRDLVGTPARSLATLMENQKNMSPFAFGDGVSPNKYSPLKSVETAESLHDNENAIHLDPELSSSIEDAVLPQWVNVDRDNMKPDDGGQSWLDLVGNGSPFLKKQSAARPSVARAHTSTGILGDITNGSRGNMRLASPFRMSPDYNSATNNNSPTKPNNLLKSLKKDAFLGSFIESGSESDGEDENTLALDANDNVDIFKGFRSIGAGADKENASSAFQQGVKATAKSQSGRPALGRTMTNAF